MRRLDIQDALKDAVEIATAQAGVRIMDDAEISKMISALASTIKSLADANVAVDDSPGRKKKPRTKKAVWLERGKSLKPLAGARPKRRGTPN